MRGLSVFLSIFISFNARLYKEHAGRTILVLIGVALGAAVFTSVRLSVHASMEALDTSLEAVSGPAEWVASRPGRRMSDHVVSLLAGHPGIKHLAPVLSVYVQEEATGRTLRLIGVDPFLERSFRGADGLGGTFETWRRLFAEPNTLVLGSAASAELGLKQGDPVRLMSGRGTSSCRIIDVQARHGLAGIDGGLVALGDLATVQEISGQLHRVDRVNLVLASESQPRAIAALLPEGVSLDRSSQQRQTGTDMVQAYDFNLTMLSFVSLFVGMFLVYSVVALNAASRRFQVAVLRSIGASRRLVFCLFLLEGGCLGLLGWVLAMPAGLVLTRWLLNDVSQTVSTLFIQVAVQGAGIDPWEIGLSFAVTLAVAVLASVQPAREAMQVPPWEAMRTVRNQGQQNPRVTRSAWWGLGLIVAAWPVSQLSSPGPWPVFPYLATFGLFIGFALTAPLLLQLLSRGVTPKLAAVGGTAAFLAGRTMEQAGPRIAISAGALITAMALFVSLSIMTTSFQKTFTLWINETISGDLFIRPLNAESNAYHDPMPARAREWIEAHAGRAVLLPYQRYHLTYGDVPVQLETLDVLPFQKVGGFLFLQGVPAQALERVQNSNGVLVSEAVAAQAKVAVGDSFALEVAGQELNGEVAGVIRSYRTRGGVVFASRAWFEEQTGVSEWSGVRVFFPGPQSQERARAFRQRLIGQTGLASGLEVTLGTDLRAEVLSIFKDTFAVTTVLLIIALVVSGLGITTTLAIIILERKRDISTLTAIGAQSSQIRSLVFWEAGYLVSIGIAAGFICGFILSAILVFVVNKVSFGWTFAYSVDWPELGTAVPLAFGAALLAAVPVLRLIRKLPAALALRQE